MINHEQQDDAAPSPAPLSPTGAARRRIAGLGVSGVVMTVASNNAMAALVCKSPSGGALSGNLNSQKPNVKCDGMRPEDWRKDSQSWPSDVKTSDRFGKFFPSHGKLAELSCKQVLSKRNDVKTDVAMYLMATYLNVASGRISFLTRQGVVKMWVQYDLYGTYTPAEGATPWSPAELVRYLASTQS